MIHGRNFDILLAVFMIFVKFEARGIFLHRLIKIKNAFRVQRHIYCARADTFRLALVRESFLEPEENE